VVASNRIRALPSARGSAASLLAVVAVYTNPRPKRQVRKKADYFRSRPHFAFWRSSWSNRLASAR
jgi:hypothetical protein